MKLQIKTIRFVCIMSLILAIITYAVTLNVEVGYINLETPWISNNFVLTVCGGAFASMLVVLACELQKYFELKRATQDEMFRHTGYIYMQLIILKNQIQNWLASPDQLIPKEILDNPAQYLRNEISILTGIEYSTFSKKEDLHKRYIDFSESTLRDVLSFVNCINYLTIAVNTDKINNLILTKHEGSITSASPLTNKTLNKFYAELDPFIEKADLFLQFMDGQCGNRFNWSLRKLAMQMGMEQPSHMTFEEFISQ